METLTLEHLAPYLPYGLKCQMDNGDIFILKQLAENCAAFNEIRGASGLKYGLCFLAIKPLLRPLSDLGKQAPRTVVGIRSVDEINKDCMYHLDAQSYLFDLPESIEIVDLWDSFTGLFKYHYDLFGLIDVGLAIDINSIK